MKIRSTTSYSLISGKSWIFLTLALLLNSMTGWGQITLNSQMNAPITISGLPGTVCGATGVGWANSDNPTIFLTDDQVYGQIQSVLQTVPYENRVRVEAGKDYNFSFSIQGPYENGTPFGHFSAPYPQNDANGENLGFDFFAGVDGSRNWSSGRIVSESTGIAWNWKYNGTVSFPTGTKDGYVAIRLVETNVLDPYTAYLVFTTVVIPIVVEGPTTPLVDSLGTTVEPQMPYLVLHAPPGDGSSSEFLENKSTCRQTESSVADKGSVSANLGVKLGAKGSIGFISTVDFEFSVTFTAGVSASDLSVVTTSDQTCVNVSQGFSTSALTGPDIGSGDIFIGYGTDLAYGLYEYVTSDPNTCSIYLDTSFVYKPTGEPRKFIYTKQAIESDIVTQQAIANDTTRSVRARNVAQNQIDVWNQVLAINLENINNPDNEVLGVTSFSGATSSSNSESISVVNTRKINYEQFFETSAGIQTVFEIAGSGVSGGFEVKGSRTYGQSQNQTAEGSKLVKYTFNDDDIGDVFNVNVVRDPMFGTPIFRLDPGSKSSCPYQGGYQRDQPYLTFSDGSQEMTLSDVPSGAPATFRINICNQSNEPRTYHLQGNSATNTNNAVLEGFGNNLFANTDLGAEFWMLPPDSCIQDAIVTIEQKDLDITDYENIELYLYSACQPSTAPIASSIYLNAFFEPQVATVTPIGAIANENGVPHEGVSIDLISGFNVLDNTLSDAFGNYSFLSTEATNRVRPVKNDNARMGISIADIARINRHILQLLPLDTDYKLIAADVNKDGNINIADVAITRRVFLQIFTEFPNNTSWRFLPIYADVASNPLDVNHPEEILLDQPNLDYNNLDFVSVKVGDVDNSALLQEPIEVESRGMDISLEVPGIMINTSDEDVKVPVLISGGADISAFSLEINYDMNDLDLVRVESDLMESFGEENYHDTGGRIIVGWDHPLGETYSAEGELLNLVFRSTVETGEVEIGLEETNAFDAGLTRIPVNHQNGTIVINTAENENAEKNYRVSATPNPFENYINFEVITPDPQELSITLTDVSGKILKVINMEEASEHFIRVDDLDYRGTIIAQVKGENFSEVMMLVKM